VRQLLKWADGLVLVVVNLFLAGLLIIVLLQVFFRYVLAYPLPWTEEVGVYLFVWASFLAAALVVGMNDHFSISLLVERLGSRKRWVLDVIITLLCISFALIMVWQGTVWSWRMLPMFSPVLQLPQGAVYAVVPLSGLYMTAHLAVRLTTLLDTRASTRTGEGQPC